MGGYPFDIIRGERPEPLDDPGLLARRPFAHPTTPTWPRSPAGRPWTRRITWRSAPLLELDRMELTVAVLDHMFDQTVSG
jgi:hypothetical protein